MGLAVHPKTRTSHTHRLKFTSARLKQRHLWILALAPILLAFGCVSSSGPQWVGKGKYRLRVKVEPFDLGSRKSDELPATIEMSADDLRRSLGISGRIDVSTLQVERYDAASGKPLRYGNWAYAQAEWELPFRWYDGSIPEQFPEFAGNIDKTQGKLQYTNTRGWGYFYETLGEWKRGRLAWIHTQEESQPSYYALYFDVLAEGQTPGTVDRRGFMGDGFERITEIGPSTHGVRIGRVETADWNGDGVTDLLVGGERGGLIWFPNQGSRTEPHFPFPKLMFLADGRPFDVGFSSAILCVDWDGDGVRDLLSGAEWNRVIWFKNVGNNNAPKLEYQGFVMSDGKPLSIPHEPNPEIKGIYKTDYHPVLAVGDWNGDGNEDLLAGGYVTGMIFWFENTGPNENHLPVLKFRGPVTADSHPIDTGWGAAPCLADFDGDGDLDLISGSMSMTAEGGDSASSENYLYYFENIGNSHSPRLTRRPFPLRGRFHEGTLATPRATDLNGDGLLDLVVSEGTQIYLFMNVGSRASPLWEYSPQPLEGRWNTAPIWGQPIDWNGDQRFDLVSEFSVYLNQGLGNPQVFGAPLSILPDGERIFHKSPVGDQWTFTQVADLDADGKIDILYGVHEGHVYFHRNMSRGDRKHFDTVGVQLKMVNGKPIQVGPQPGQKMDFDVLQGARTTFAVADFDRDGRLDLVVGDTYGKVRYYQNISGGDSPLFALPVLIAEVGSRLVPTTADWNGDGWPDVLIGASSGRVQLLLNSGGASGERFLSGGKLEVPRVPFGSTVMALDWNGDGDVDLLNYASYGYLCWYDRSFVEHGYAPAKLERWERHPRK